MDCDIQEDRVKIYCGEKYEKILSDRRKKKEEEEAQESEDDEKNEIVSLAKRLFEIDAEIRSLGWVETTSKNLIEIRNAKIDKLRQEKEALEAYLEEEKLEVGTTVFDEILASIFA